MVSSDWRHSTWWRQMYSVCSWSGPDTCCVKLCEDDDDDSRRRRAVAHFRWREGPAWSPPTLRSDRVDGEKKRTRRSDRFARCDGFWQTQHPPHREDPAALGRSAAGDRSEEHTSELQRLPPRARG